MRILVFFALLMLAMVIAGMYGALHDQLSFTVSHEYFTKFKYDQFGLVEAPLAHRVKAALIGFLASWWMGIPIGVMIGGMGFRYATASAMFRGSLLAMGVVAGVALLTGLTGLAYGTFVASSDPADYVDFWYLPDDLEFPARFLSVGHMHNFSYLGGLLGLIVGAVVQFRQAKASHRKP